MTKKNGAFLKDIWSHTHDFHRDKKKKTKNKTWNICMKMYSERMN